MEILFPMSNFPLLRFQKSSLAHETKFESGEKFQKPKGKKSVLYNVKKGNEINVEMLYFYNIQNKAY